MDILNSIITLLYEQKKQQQDLTSHLGLEKSAFTGWKSGKSQSYLKYLPEIAEFFGVTVDALIGNGDTSPVAQTDQEAKLLEMFRSMSELGKARLLLLADRISREEKATPSTVAAYGGKNSPVRKRK